jgi:hypothetical protein
LSQQYPSLYKIAQRKQVSVANNLANRHLNVTFLENSNTDMDVPNWASYLGNPGVYSEEAQEARRRSSSSKACPTRKYLYKEPTLS